MDRKGTFSALPENYVDTKIIFIPFAPFRCTTYYKQQTLIFAMQTKLNFENRHQLYKPPRLSIRNP